ncbi:hypothetical protein [Paraburkholderia sp. J12]|uniref:hypothetical protein n=1 Tax=Paraburkholderia sp. J12 TaxID=2805432 RepID=UPI002ABD8869|nr:hypothetical protein [Paraburkholderia sp. J12]
MASFKAQQWNSANYALLLYAALVTIAAFAGKPSVCEKYVLCGLAVLTLAFGVVVIKGLDDAIELRRDRQTRIRKHFTREFDEARGDAREWKSFGWLFYPVLAVGCGVTIVLIVGWFPLLHASGS